MIFDRILISSSLWCCLLPCSRSSAGEQSRRHALSELVCLFLSLLYPLLEVMTIALTGLLSLKLCSISFLPPSGTFPILLRKIRFRMSEICVLQRVVCPMASRCFSINSQPIHMLCLISVMTIPSFWQFDSMRATCPHSSLHNKHVACHHT